MATTNFKKPVNPFKKGEDEQKKLISRLGTEVDGLEAYARVLEMDGVGDSKQIKGIYHQIDLIRDLLEQLS